jgi:hypothetical protein
VIAMRGKILAVLVVVVAVMGVSPAAMAKGGGGGGGGGGKGGWSHGGMHGHGHFDHRFARRFFNWGLFNSFGWGGDWVWGGYGDSGYGGNNTVVVFPQAIPQAATGPVDPTPCNWKQQEFTVPSAAGGTRPVQVVNCH